MDIKNDYCGNCHQFHSAITIQEPINLNGVIDDLQLKVRQYLALKPPLTIQIQQFMFEGCMHWRSHIKIGDSVWKSSRTPQVTPTDALRELTEIVASDL